MKIITLTLIAVSIFLALIIFSVFIYSINSELESQADYGGGSVDLDPELQPSYSSYYHQIFKFNSIFVAGPIILGVVSLIFIIRNIVLRVKKIPTKKYTLVIAAVILIFFGISWIHSGLSGLTPDHFERQTDSEIILIGALIPIGIGAIPLILGISILKKANWRIRK